MLRIIIIFIFLIIFINIQGCGDLTEDPDDPTNEDYLIVYVINHTDKSITVYYHDDLSVTHLDDKTAQVEIGETKRIAVEYKNRDGHVIVEYNGIKKNYNVDANLFEDEEVNVNTSDFAPSN